MNTSRILTLLTAPLYDIALLNDESMDIREISRGEDRVTILFFNGMKVSIVVETAVDSTKLTLNEISLIKHGKIIDAIKEVRVRLQLGLKEAKELVDKWRSALARQEE